MSAKSGSPHSAITSRAWIRAQGVDLSRAIWQKSGYSGSNGGQCVEVARNLPGIVAVRDSKDPDGPSLVLTPAEWRAFSDGVRRGEFSLG